jgi:hypothetical protein
MKTATKKRRLALFVAVIMALSLWTALPIQASADDIAAQTVPVDSAGFMYFIPAHTDATAAATKATIIGYTGTDATPIIPPSVTVGGIPYDVNKIGAGAFAANPSLRTVTIPSTITWIEANAFYACTELTSVTFAEPVNITNIENYAFYNCTKLTMTEDDLPDIAESRKGINILGKDPSGVVTGSAGDYRCSVVNGKATLWNFTGNPTAASIQTSVTVGGTPYSVTGLGAGTFNGRVSLASITIDETKNSVF